MEFERTLLFQPQSNLAGVILEPVTRELRVSGFQSGAFKLVNEYGGVTISNESRTGFGRCGQNFWGFQNTPNHVIPDIIVFGGGIRPGIGDVSAVISREGITENSSINSTPLPDYHPLTYFMAVASLSLYHTESIQINCSYRGVQLRDRLNNLVDCNPDICLKHYGTGLLRGIAIRNEIPVSSIALRLQQDGILVDTTVDNHIILQPSLGITSRKIDYAVDKLDQALSEFHYRGKNSYEFLKKFRELSS
jgi:4-aminobutyrate aminotransferase